MPIVQTDPFNFSRISTILVAASNSLDVTLAPVQYRCTGTNDDVVINAALVAASAVGGSVSLLEGDYNTVLTLNVPANVTLMATGWGAVINFNAGGNAITVTGDNVKLRDFKVVIVAGAGGVGTRPNAVYAMGRTNVEVTKLWLVGDTTVADDGSTLRQNGIIFTTVTESKIVNCRSEQNDRSGILLTSSTDNMLIGNTCNGNTRYGILLTANSDNNTVTGNTCNTNTRYGIFLSGSDNNTVAGNTCYDNGDIGVYAGIYLSSSQYNTVDANTCTSNNHYGIFLTLTSYYNTVTGNTCNRNTQHGILFTSGANSTVTGNACNRNIQHGIFISSSNYNTVTGNTCNGNGFGGTYSGIQVTSSGRNVICGNNCQSNTDYGIRLDGDSDYNKISNNYTNGNTTGSIRIDDATCTTNQIEFNTLEEAAPSDAGTTTRAYGNFDPSANAFHANIGADPW